mmetsp:Transcript_34731/g.70908  ORF Transcript_34731/g.70908 Transcript_34731/m.70908 type:complete len:211 (+) Transcript_34731:87-719(+)
MMTLLHRCSTSMMIRSAAWTGLNGRCCGIQHQRYNNISTTAAKSLLGFSEDTRPSIRELRNAYFESAKRCHPDVVNQQQLDGEEDNTSFDFRDITIAYEHLLNGDHIEYNPEEADNIVTRNEEEEYRDACKTMLGLPAEIVEESKQNPMFLKWLTGNTDAALHWRSFFAANGGLAQKLRPPAGYLGRGKDAAVRKSDTRRKRGRRSTTSK